MAEIKSQRTVQSIRHFNCPNCGNELELINKRSRYVGCNACGTVMDARSEAHEVIMRLHAPTQYKPLNFLRLGMEGFFEGETYRILGRTRWKSTYLEYWEEGAYQGWGHEFWEYDEWVLMNKNQQYFYLIEDSLGFYISKPFLPKTPQVPNSSFLSVHFNGGKPVNITETGNSEVLFFEGESTYQIHAGDHVSFHEYKEAGNSYIFETRFDKNGEATEIEFFEEIPISLSKIRTAFAKDPIVDRVNREVYGKYSFTKWLFAFTTVLSFVFWMYGLFYSGNLLYFGDLKFAPAMTNILKTDTTVSQTDYDFDSVAVLTIDSQSNIDTVAVEDKYIDKTGGYTEPILPAYDFAHITVPKSYKNKSVYREASYHLVLPQTSTVNFKSDKLYKVKAPVGIKHWFWVKDKKVMSSETITESNISSYDEREYNYNNLYYRPDVDMNLSLAVAPDMLSVDDTLIYNPQIINNVSILESPWDTFPLFILFVCMLTCFVFSRKIAELLFGNKTVEMIFNELEAGKKGVKE